MNTKRNIKIEPFEKYYERYDAWFEEREFAYKSELAAVREMLPPSGLGLEIGVGSGRFAAPLGIKYGMEPASAMLEMAVRRGVSCVRGVAEKLPFRDSAFDYAAMITVICFLENIPAAFAEAYRVLRPGGALIVGFIDRTTPAGEKYEKNKHDSDFYWPADFYSPEEVKSFMTKSGFTNINFVQTISGRTKNMKDQHPVYPGCGEGLFVVAKGIK